jgi:hypothetical protein
MVCAGKRLGGSVGEAVVPVWQSLGLRLEFLVFREPHSPTVSPIRPFEALPLLTKRKPRLHGRVAKVFAQLRGLGDRLFIVKR